MSIALSRPSPTKPKYDPDATYTVEEYHQLIQAGVLDKDDKVELLEERIVPKMSRKPDHDMSIDKTHEAISTRAPKGRRIRIQSAITTGDSEPEPDVTAVLGPVDRYRFRHPGPEDIDVLIEVAESSLEKDRTVKRRIYARARIAPYWIVNLVDSIVEVYADPTGPDANPHYRSRTDYGIEDSVPLVIDGRECGPIPVRELLP